MRRVYIKRNGGMIFWRLFAIGGSFYIATQSDAAKQERKEARARNRMMLRNRAKLANTYDRIACAYGYSR